MHRADHGDDHRLAPHHVAHLPARHPHHPEQPELTGALVDREEQRVHDPEDGDDLGEHEQADQHRDVLVDGVLLLGLEALAGAEVDVGEVVAQVALHLPAGLRDLPGFAFT